MATDTTTIIYKTMAGAVSQANIVQDGGSRTLSYATVSAGAINQHVSLSIVASTLISFLIISSRDVTLKTNSSSSPDQTISLKAGVGFTWNQQDIGDNPITTDITGLYFTNPGAVDAAVQMSFLLQ